MRGSGEMQRKQKSIHDLQSKRVKNTIYPKTYSDKIPTRGLVSTISIGRETIISRY